MLVAVFSDTHGSVGRAVEAVRRTSPDAIIHLGDGERDVERLRAEFPDIPLYSVRGNCDHLGLSPDKAVVQLGAVTAFLTHGHLYSGLRWGQPDALVYAAQEAGAQLALFGHTHQADYFEIGGVKLLNPGSAGQGAKRSWATVQIFDNGGFACEIKEL